jgi:hypothetical protein
MTGDDTISACSDQRTPIQEGHFPIQTAILQQSPGAAAVTMYDNLPLCSRRPMEVSMTCILRQDKRLAPSYNRIYPGIPQEPAVPSSPVAQ